MPPRVPGRPQALASSLRARGKLRAGQRCRRQLRRGWRRPHLSLAWNVSSESKTEAGCKRRPRSCVGVYQTGRGLRRHGAARATGARARENWRGQGMRFVPAHDSRRMGRKYYKTTATASIELNKIDNEKFNKYMASRPCDRPRNRGDPPAQALGTATTRLAAPLPPLPRGGAASASPLPRCCPVTDQGSPRPGRVAASCDRPRSSSAQRASLADGSGLAWPCFRALVSERRSTQRFGPIGALGHTSQRFGARAARSPRVESDSRDRPGSPAGERGRR